MASIHNPPQQRICLITLLVNYVTDLKPIALTSSIFSVLQWQTHYRTPLVILVQENRAPFKLQQLLKICLFICAILCMWKSEGVCGKCAARHDCYFGGDMIISFSHILSYYYSLSLSVVGVCGLSLCLISFLSPLWSLPVSPPLSSACARVGVGACPRNRDGWIYPINCGSPWY